MMHSGKLEQHVGSMLQKTKQWTTLKDAETMLDEVLQSQVITW